MILKLSKIGYKTTKIIQTLIRKVGLYDKKKA